MNISEHRGYNTWLNMMQRCYNQIDKRYIGYGSRGISVCEEWHDAYVFCDYYDATKTDDTLTHDRIDNDGNYEPTNCRWVSKSIQQQNRRYAKEHTQTGYKGVRINRGKFQTRIHINKKCVVVGTYHTALEAAIAYNEYIDLHSLEHCKIKIEETKRIREV